MKQGASIQGFGFQNVADRLREQKEGLLKKLGVTEEAKLCRFMNEFLKFSA